MASKIDPIDMLAKSSLTPDAVLVCPYNQNHVTLMNTRACTCCNFLVSRVPCAKIYTTHARRFPLLLIPSAVPKVTCTTMTTHAQSFALLLTFSRQCQNQHYHVLPLTPCLHQNSGAFSTIPNYTPTFVHLLALSCYL